MKYIIGLALICVLLTGCTQLDSIENGPSDSGPESISEEIINDSIQAESMVLSYTDITVEEAKMKIDENPYLIIIDVSPVYADGHLPGAINYYVGDGSLDKAIPTFDPEAEYLVYCHVDSASISGAQKLVDAGFTNVYRLEGNYAAWVDAGYPTE